MTGFDADECARQVNAAAHVIAARDIATANARTDQWMKLGRKYEDVLYELRLAEDNPAGHAQFYREAARIIFGEAEYERVFEDDDQPRRSCTACGSDLGADSK